MEAPRWGPTKSGGASGDGEAPEVAKSKGLRPTSCPEESGKPERSRGNMGPKDGREIPEGGKGPDRAMGAKEGSGTPRESMDKETRGVEEGSAGKGCRSGKVSPEMDSLGQEPERRGSAGGNKAPVEDTMGRHESGVCTGRMGATSPTDIARREHHCEKAGRLTIHSGRGVRRR